MLLPLLLSLFLPLNKSIRDSLPSIHGTRGVILLYFGELDVYQQNWDDKTVGGSPEVALHSYLAACYPGELKPFTAPVEHDQERGSWFTFTCFTICHPNFCAWTQKMELVKPSYAPKNGTHNR